MIKPRDGYEYVYNDDLMDAYGNIIVPGKRVAFNYSGQVRIGVIKALHGAVRNPWGVIRCKIEVEHNGQSSFVTSPLNLVVLERFK